MSGTEFMPALLAHQTLQAQYELLRAAALGEQTAVNTRSGLTVLLRQGMWSWARVIARGQMAQGTITPFAAQASRLDKSSDRRAVVHLLAALAMTLSDRRTG
jgi:hypothetical protein